MKKFYVFIIIFILLCVICFSLLVMNKSDIKEVETFSVNDYNEFIDLFGFPRDDDYYNSRIEKGFLMVREKITDYDTALNCAKEVFEEFFPNCDTYKKYYVGFDESEKIWFIHGVLEDNMLGGTPCLMIRENGEIVAIWHGK